MVGDPDCLLSGVEVYRKEQMMLRSKFNISVLGIQHDHVMSELQRT
jgi:hypothetical protein